MKIIIIDDEPLARTIIVEYLQAWPQLVVAQECADGFEGLKAIQSHQPALIFLDVQMPKLTGFELLELLTPPFPGVIFTTAFDAYALKAFEANAVDYLLKPFSQQRFDQALRKWMEKQKIGAATSPEALWHQFEEQVSAQRERVVVRHRNTIRVIPVNEIRYFEASGDFVKLYTADGAFLKNKTLTYFEKSLDENRFVRCLRSFMVQVANITRLEPYEKENYLAVLQTGEQVPVSKAGYAKLRQVLGL